MRIATYLVFWTVLATVPDCLAQPPADLDPHLEMGQSGVHLTLIAEHPDVVTPTGIDVDAAGNVWAVSSHTHFRPEDYEGPQHDEVVVISQDGSRSVFYDSTDATMDLELGTGDWVYLAERDRILRVKDTDGDGRGDMEQNIAVLDTEAIYPHNGLSGLAWHPSGDLLFSLGENFWRAWTLTASDQQVISGTGEGGIFRCRPDGSNLRRVAKGFWNPFGVCVREDGTIFVSENDPGARPPCRLLHVVEGGDYGYQRIYGETPFHPFVCWDGELRGTLPMLHAIGEAPCGIAALGNGLIVPSWTDHRIDFYPLTPKGASFDTRRVNLVSGGQHFRPTCITQASPTVFYLTDWVYGSYQLHGRGRLWKLEIDPSAADWLGETKIPKPTREARTAQQLREGSPSFTDSQLLELARSEDAFLRRTAIDAMAARVGTYDARAINRMSVEDQITVLLALRKSEPTSATWVRHFLASENPELRFETLRWIADEHLTEFQSDVESMFDQYEIDYRIYEACLAAWNTLSGNPRAGVADADMLLPRISDSKASPRARAYALRLLDPQHKRFSPELWEELYRADDRLLLTELTRALVAAGTSDAKAMLIRIATDEDIDSVIRCDAVAGLAGSDQQTLKILIDLAGSTDRALSAEALRSIRFTKFDDAQRQRLKDIAAKSPDCRELVAAALDPLTLKQSRPQAGDIAAWQQRLAAVEPSIDLDAGRRIFHHANLSGCANCHRHLGRGNSVGPDLSAASNRGDPDRLLRALLEPSRDVDPQYFPRMLVTEDGQVFTGIMLRDGGGGQEIYRDDKGRERKFRTAEIIQRKELTTSMMPDGLVDSLTDRELRDLLAFLDRREALNTMEVENQPRDKSGAIESEF